MSSPLAYTAFFVFAALFCLFLSFAAFIRRSAAGARTFGVLMLASAIYSLGSAYEVSSASLPRLLFFAKVEYVGLALASPLWLLFALRFAERPTPRPPVLALLFLEPLASLVLVWTNEAHGLFYSRAWIREDGPFILLAVEHGPWYWAHMGATWIMLAAGVFILVRYAAFASARVKRSALVAVAGILAPLASNLIGISGAMPHSLDLGPLALCVSGALFAWAIMSKRFLDFLPVARERVLESLHEGLVILDSAGRVADFNPAARSLLGLGQGAGRVEISAAIAKPELSALTAAGEGGGELVLPGEGGNRRIQARAFPVQDERGRKIGASLLLLDVTETSELLERLAELASQDSLTGALNRRRFDEIGARDLELARRNGSSVGLLMLDRQRRVGPSRRRRRAPRHRRPLQG
jgi:PAS domain-containing protein